MEREQREQQQAMLQPWGGSEELAPQPWGGSEDAIVLARCQIRFLDKTVSVCQRAIRKSNPDAMCELSVGSTDASLSPSYSNYTSSSDVSDIDEAVTKVSYLEVVDLEGCQPEPVHAFLSVIEGLILLVRFDNRARGGCHVLLPGDVIVSRR